VTARVRNVGYNFSCFTQPKLLLENNWQALVIKRVEDSVETTLDRFYSSDNPDDVSQKMLILLANKPNLTLKEIAQMLGSSEKFIWDKIGDLESLDKVRKQGLEYRIVGSIIEGWGQKTKDISFVKSRRTQLINVLPKFAFAVVFLVLSAITYFYANPPLRTFNCKFNAGELFVQMPSLLEENESGTAKISIQNISKAKLSSLSASFNSKNIESKI